MEESNEKKSSTESEDADDKQATSESCQTETGIARKSNDESEMPPRKRYKGAMHKDRPICSTCLTQQQLQIDGRVPLFCSRCATPLIFTVEDFKLGKYECWRERSLDETDTDFLDEACGSSITALQHNHMNSLCNTNAVKQEPTSSYNSSRANGLSSLSEYLYKVTPIPVVPASAQSSERVNTGTLYDERQMNHAESDAMSFGIHMEVTAAPSGGQSQQRITTHNQQLMNIYTTNNLTPKIKDEPLPVPSGASNVQIVDVCPSCFFVIETPSSEMRPLLCVKCNTVLRPNSHTQLQKELRTNNQTLQQAETWLNNHRRDYGKAAPVSYTLRPAEKNGEAYHACDVCEAVLASKDKLARHMVTVHSNERPYQCKVCLKTFKLSYQFNRHMKVTHPEVENWYDCDRCGYECNQKSRLNDHIRACSRGYQRVGDIEALPCTDHVKSEPETDKKPQTELKPEKVHCDVLCPCCFSANKSPFNPGAAQTCVKCDSVLRIAPPVPPLQSSIQPPTSGKSGADTRDHYPHDAEVNETKSESPPSPTNEPLSPPPPSDDPPLSDVECQDKMSDKDPPQDRLEDTSTPSEQANSSHLETINESNNGEKVNAEAERSISPTLTSTESQPDGNLVKVYFPKDWKGDGFKAGVAKDDLISKVERVDVPYTDVDSQHSCEYCDAWFLHSSKLTRHLKTVHSEERPFKCDVCEKTFKIRDSLTSHQRVVHEGKKQQYRCQYCTQRFTQKSLRAEHLQTAHPDETAKASPQTNGNTRKTKRRKRFRCDVCSERFYNRGTLRQHKEEIHTPDTSDDGDGVISNSGDDCQSEGEKPAAKSDELYNYIQLLR